MKEVWILFGRREFVRVFATREAACDYFTRMMSKRKIAVGWIQESEDIWIVHPKYGFGRVTVQKVEVES